MITKEITKNPLKKDFDKVIKLIESQQMTELAYKKTTEILNEGIKHDFIAFFWSRSNNELKCVFSNGYKTKLSYGAMSEVGDYIPVFSLTSANLKTLKSLFSVLNSDNEESIKSLLSEKIGKTFGQINLIMINSCTYNNSEKMLDYIGTEFTIPLDFYSKSLIYDLFTNSYFRGGSAEQFLIIDAETFELADQLKVIESYVFEIYADMILDRDGSIDALPLDKVIGFLTKNYKSMNYRYEELNSIFSDDFEVNFTNVVMEDLKTFVKKSSGLIYNKSQEEFSQVSKLESDFYSLISVFEKSKNIKMKKIFLETFKELEQRPISWWSIFYPSSPLIKDFIKSIFNEENAPILNWSIHSFDLSSLSSLSDLDFVNGLVIYLFGRNGVPYFVSSKISTYGSRRFCSKEKLDFSSFNSTLYTTKKQNKIIDFYLENHILSEDVKETLLTVKSFPLAPWDK